MRQGETKIDRQSQSAISTRPLRNLGFEDGLKGWETDVYAARPTIDFDPSVLRKGRHSLRVPASQLAHTAFGQEVMLKPGYSYRLASWARTRGLQPHGSPVYGTFQIQHTKGHHLYRARRAHSLTANGTNHGGDTEWTEVTITLKEPATGWARIVTFFIGFCKGTGTARFDDLKRAPAPRRHGDGLGFRGHHRGFRGHHS